MQDYLNVIFKYWYFFLPLSIAILIVVWLLIRRGYLHEINIFGLRFDLKRDKSDDGKYIDNPRKKSPSLRDYEIKFSKTAVESVSSLKITQEKVIRLVENEFTHHVNYFKWDLLDYPLPVQEGYIVFIDKVGNTVTFRGIKRADFNELEIASLNDLLAIYRRLSRFEYRLNKKSVLRPEMVTMIVDQHKEIIRRLIRHYEIFRQVILPGKDKFPVLFLEYLSSETNRSVGIVENIRDFTQKLSPNSKGFALNILAATSALYNIDEIIANEENGLISQDEADKELVLCLERSLQYIHKMINVCLE